MKRMRIKALLSSFLMLLFLLVFISGAMLYFGKTGVILGFRRAFIRDFHSVCALLMLPAIICHAGLNFGLFRQELKKLFGFRSGKRR